MLLNICNYIRFKVQWFTPALPVPRPGRDREGRLDMHAWNDRTEFYSKGFYATGEESQVWARGSRLTDENWNNPRMWLRNAGVSFSIKLTASAGRGGAEPWALNLTTWIVSKFLKSPGCIRKIPLNPPLQKGEAIGMPGLIEILQYFDIGVLDLIWHLDFVIWTLFHRSSFNRGDIFRHF